MKKLLRRHISVLTALGIYWPFLFWLTHTPVQKIARRSGVGDKLMHVVAYFILTFLVWFATCPYEKVRWNRAKHWFVMLAVILYGILDEFIQGKVGRSADVHDFAADCFGVVLALGVLSILGFWSSLLTLSAVFIFILSDVTQLMMLQQYAPYATVFHFTAYTAFTVIWTQWLQRYARFRLGTTKWFAVSLALPLGLLLTVKVMAPLWGRPLNIFDTAVAAFGIILAVLGSWTLLRLTSNTNHLK